MKSWIWEKRFSKFGSLGKVMYWQFKSPFSHENAVFRKILQLETNCWRFQNMWNLKINLGSTFWDILTLHQCKLKIKSVLCIFLSISYIISELKITNNSIDTRLYVSKEDESLPLRNFHSYSWQFGIENDPVDSELNLKLNAGDQNFTVWWTWWTN